MRHILIACLLAGCTLNPYPAPPDEEVPGTCASAEENRDRLGGCGIGDDFEELCLDAEQAEAEIGIRLPVGCMTHAASCAEFKACR